MDAGLVDLGQDGRLRVRTPVRELVLRRDGPAYAPASTRASLPVSRRSSDGCAPDVVRDVAPDGLARLSATTTR